MTTKEEERAWQDPLGAWGMEIQNDDHQCVNCDAMYPCERPTWQDCDCRIYCGRCEEARQETSGP